MKFLSQTQQTVFEVNEKGEVTTEEELEQLLPAIRFHDDNLHHVTDKLNSERDIYLNLAHFKKAVDWDIIESTPEKLYYYLPRIASELKRHFLLFSIESYKTINLLKALFHVTNLCNEFLLEKNELLEAFIEEQKLEKKFKKWRQQVIEENQKQESQETEQEKNKIEWLNEQP